MNLVDFVPFLSVLTLASLGLASVALALLVWRRRGLGAQGANRRVSWVRRCSLPVAVLGGLMLLVSFCLRTFFPRRGEVFMRDAVVVRADVSRGTPVIVADARHAAGEKLVAFVRSGQDAEVAALRLKRDRIVNEAGRIPDAPDRTDAAVIRRELDLATERRALEQRRSMLEIEHLRLAQLIRSDLLDRRVRRHDVKVQLGEYDGKLQRISALLNYDTLLAEQSRDLHEADFISKAVLARRQRDTQVSVADRQRLQVERKEKQALLDSLDRGIATLDTALVGHESHVAVATAKLDAEFTGLAKAQEVWSARRELERLRCARESDAELRELEIQREECDAALDGIAQRSSVVAPYDGSVLYRHEAPGAAQSGDPILLFGPEGAVRARFRLSDSEARGLRGAGVVSLMVTSEEMVDPNLTAEFVGSSPIEREDGMVLAELSCVATKGQVRYLARGRELEARLLWAPTPFLDPLFSLGLAGLIGGLLMFLRPIRAVPAPATVAQAEAVQRGAGVTAAQATPPLHHVKSCRRREVRRESGERRRVGARDLQARGCRRRGERRVIGERRSPSS